jgi:hypothetical protein
LEGGGAGADCDEESFAGAPDGFERTCGAEFAEAFFDAFGDEAEGEFAEGGEVGVFEETIGGGAGAVGEVDFAFLETFAEGFWGEVDELDLVGEFEDGIGDGLVDGGAGDLTDGVGAAFDVLDVERGEDVDTGVEEFDDVLVTFGVAPTFGVGVGELVHEDEAGAGLAAEEGVEVHLGDIDAAVGEVLAGEDGEAGEEGLGLGAAVGLDDGDEEVGSFLELLLGGAEHGVGLAHAGAHAEEDFQAAATGALFLALEGGEEGVGIGTAVVVVSGIGHGVVTTNEH